MHSIVARLGIVASCMVVAGMWTLPAVAQDSHTTIGVGAGILPKYEGSKKYTARPYPTVHYRSGNFFIAPKAEMPSIGLQTQLTPGWTVGVFGGYQWGRKASDDPHLYGTKRIHDHLNAGVFTQYAVEDFTLSATYYHALRSGYGSGLQLGGTYKVWQEGLSAVRIGGNLSFMDKDAMRRHFGITAGESVASGGRLSAFHPSGGLKSVTVYSAYSYQLSESWNVNAAIGLKNLTGDARKSPLTERETSVYGSVGVGYSF